MHVDYLTNDKIFVFKEIGELCKKYNVVCIADEVYEMNVFPEFEHVNPKLLKSLSFVEKVTFT